MEPITPESLPRPPIVTILGHVDHGKTSLLDKIRKSNIVAKEAGGITQSIGASMITTGSGKRITFIDTPGHAAFSQMRSRGAKVADIAILVVASDDGVKPQTQEAIKLILSAQIPFIVAATKVDLPASNIDSLYGQLEKEGLLFEGRGGQTPLVKVSAKTGEGVDELLDMISLVAEMGGTKGSPEANLDAVVIETTKDRSGPLVSIVVRDGSIALGQVLFTHEGEAKVRALFNDKRESIKSIGPGEACQILGFERLPMVGSPIRSSVFSANEESKRKVGTKIQKDEIPVIIKTANMGSLEAIIAGIPKEVVVLESGVGDVTESDILLTRTLQAILVVFEAKVSPNVLKLAEAEKVQVLQFKIIYELFEKLADIIKSGLRIILGRAQVLASFPFENKKVAGCKVLEGRIAKQDRVVLSRNQVDIANSRISSMRKAKIEIQEAKPSEEFGLILDPQLDFQVGDVILSVSK